MAPPLPLSYPLGAWLPSVRCLASPLVKFSVQFRWFCLILEFHIRKSIITATHQDIVSIFIFLLLTCCFMGLEHSYDNPQINTLPPQQDCKCKRDETMYFLSTPWFIHLFLSANIYGLPTMFFVDRCLSVSSIV